MKKEYIISDIFGNYVDAKSGTSYAPILGLDFGDYEDIMSYSVRYRVDGTDSSDPKNWYVIGVDVAESVKRQKERDKKIDAILK